MRARDRRALIGGSMVVAAAWLSLKGGPQAIQRVMDLEASTRQQAELLDRAYGRLAMLPQLNDSIDRLADVAETLPHLLLVGPTGSEATTDLMSRIRPKVQENRVVILGFGTRDIDRTSGPLTAVGVVVTLESDLQGLAETLFAMEADSAVAVDQVRITAQPEHEEDPVMEILTAQVSISGWFQAAVPESTDPAALVQTED